MAALNDAGKRTEHFVFVSTHFPDAPYDPAHLPKTIE
ncbi:hypothetical protein PMI41_04240 [Phyllobacterium sp. YR531]|nr:hypothetical protein PMI41_04240 [Phyllobacterium sp. YR531]